MPGRSPIRRLTAVKGAELPNRRAAWLVAIAYILLVAVWGMSTRPFAAPDEAAHYLRALTITHGQLVGPTSPSTLPGAQTTALSPLERRFQNANSRSVRVAARSSPPGARCRDGRPDRTGSCTESSYAGNYQPLPYLLPALALAVTDHVKPAGWLTRAGSAIPAAAFLALAVLLLWDGTLWSLLGLMAAVTPMVLFVSSVLSPSGPEVSASIALFAGLLRLARAPTQAPGWIWAAVAASGATVILSWQLGPVFAGLDLALFAVLVGRETVRTLWRERRREAGGAAAVLLLALGAYLIYTAAAGASPTVIRLDQLGDTQANLDQLAKTLEQAVGDFGRLTVPLPPVIRDAWWLAVAFLALAALALGTRRDRLVLLLAAVVAALFPMLFYAAVYRYTGFDLQGRYLLPVLVLVPLLAGEIIRRRLEVLGRPAIRAALVAVTGLILLLQLSAWWINAKAQAGDPQKAWFLSAAAWSPPLGWWPWLIGSVLGVALALGGLLLAARSGRPPARGATPRPSPG